MSSCTEEPSHQTTPQPQPQPRPFEPELKYRDTAEERPAVAPDHIPPTRLRARLLGTVVAEQEEYSSALIAWSDENATGYGINDRLGDHGTIVAIEPRQIYLRQKNGDLEVMEVDAAPPESDETICPKLSLQYITDTKTVALVYTLFFSQGPIAKADVKFKPHHTREGDIDGIRVSGIRRKSTLYKLGIKNGDIIHHINGISIGEMYRSMNLNKPSPDATLRFHITRRNKQQTLEHRIK